MDELDVDLTEALTCEGEFRCLDDRKLFMRPGTIFSESCIIRFKDLTGLHLEGVINLPIMRLGQ
jgi:hypothetical protein